MDRSNYRLNAVIERFIGAYDGTSIGQDIRNMYENGTSYEVICDYLGNYGIDYEDYRED